MSKRGARSASKSATRDGVKSQGRFRVADLQVVSMGIEEGVTRREEIVDAPGTRDEVAYGDVAARRVKPWIG